MDKNKKIILVGTLTLVVGFILGLFVSHMMMRRELATLEGELLAATSAQNGSSMTTIAATTTDGSMTTAAAANLIEVSQIKVRINDGAVQWFDGTYWNEVAPVEELQQQDKFYLAKESLAAFEQQYTEAAMAATESIDATDGANATTEYADLNVGKIKNDSPKTTSQPTQTDAPATDVSTGGGSTNTGGSSDGSTSGSSSGSITTTPAPNTGTTTPTTPTTPTETPSTPAETPSTPTETPSDSNTGDGENMEWSDDYL